MAHLSTRMLSSRLLLLPRELGHLTALSPTRRTLHISSILLTSGRLFPPPLFPTPLPRPLPSSIRSQLATRMQRRRLHVSCPRPALPVIVPFLGLLKSSAALTGVTIIVRVAATLLVFSRVFLARQLGLTDPTSPRYIPRPPRVSWQAWRRHISTWPGKGDRPTYIRPPPLSDVSSEVASEVELLRNWQEGHDRSGSGLEWLMWLMKSLFFGPLLALGVVLLAGLEQTPVTGRWRVILISPAEEEVIHRALVDKGWFEAVLDLLMTPTTDPNGQEVRTPPVILPDTDWRWAWVESTLRRLETGVITAHDRLIASDETTTPQPSSPDTAFTPPPPPSHPMHPRPRAIHYLHDSLPIPSDEQATAAKPDAVPHVEGPPFQLLLLESSEPNAFSYGFGGNGASGIVVNTGILDEILASDDPTTPPSADPSTTYPTTPSLSASNTRQPRSLLSYFLPTASSSSSKAPAPPSRSSPTEEQTLRLATILAHEMSHLLLSHHLETLSATSVIIPALVGLVGDVARVMLFPLTMVFGPFVNDFVASATRPDPNGVASKVIGESCSSIHLELEADEVALRILADSNLNPFLAARFWTPTKPPSPSHLDGLTRSSDTPPPAEQDDDKKKGMMGWLRFGRAGGRSHPTGEERKKAVEKELERWVVAAATAAGKEKEQEGK